MPLLQSPRRNCVARHRWMECYKKWATTWEGYKFNICTAGETDITSVCGTESLGSIPGRCTNLMIWLNWQTSLACLAGWSYVDLDKQRTTPLSRFSINEEVRNISRNPHIINILSVWCNWLTRRILNAKIWWVRISLPTPLWLKSLEYDNSFQMVVWQRSNCERL